MKIKFLMGCADSEKTYLPNSIYEIENEQAERFINAGIAAEVETKKTERAQLKKPDNAAI